MSTVDLKAYISRTKELETAIYTERKMMEEHRKIMDQAAPAKPIMRTIPLPKEPVLHTHEAAPGGGMAWAFGGFFIGLFAVYLLLFIISSFVSVKVDAVGSLLCSGFLAYIGWLMIKPRIDEKNELAKKNEAEEQRYIMAMADYRQQLSSRVSDKQKATEEYNVATRQYNSDFEQYMRDVSGMTVKHNVALRSLEEALETHYAENIVFAKYRNLVAISTFEEYLMSGRCETLEGANGAYNLYEMELRQNVIINQLSSIISNLEQIRNNQYTLYQELTKANDTVSDVLREVRGVRENAKLAAYFAGITAMAETTPKVYVGRTF